VEAARQEVEEEERAFERTLAELRRARAFTQEQLAASLDVPQSQVSRIEHQADLYVSTLVRYIAAMGGRIEIFATFSDTDIRVPLALTDLAPAAEARQPVHA
jgi:transcriptional regulator with XRE-family HTH domain